MMTQKKAHQAGMNLSVSGARRAAERARNAAKVAADWANRSGIGQAEAAEASSAAERAALAADRAAKAESLEQIRCEAASAWSAAEAVLEADRRVSALITAAMWAQLDRRESLESGRAA
jgi:hypothetical protein